MIATAGHSLPKGLGLCAMLLLGACDSLPRDPENTTERVKEDHTIILGVVASESVGGKEAVVASRLADAFDAEVQIRRSSGEQLLASLEEGQIDLVYGEFANNSPWARHIHLGAPFDGNGHAERDRPVARLAYRNGENGWIARVERAME